MIGILAVVASLALIVSYRSSSLRGKCRDYQQLEESLDAELKEEELRAAELSKKTVSYTHLTLPTKLEV